MANFRVLEPADARHIELSYESGAQPIGAPSAFAHVYKGQLAGAGAPSGLSWIIKESDSLDHAHRYAEEYRIISALAARTAADTGGQVYSPFPVYLLEQVGEPVPALAMPYYPTELLKEIRAARWGEGQLMTQLVAYCDLIIGLHGIGYLCTDRKLTDLRWYQGHLVVLDWNLLRPITDSGYRQAELSLFARLWYGLLTGREPLQLDPFIEAHWRRPDTTSGLDWEPSLGLRVLLAAAFNGAYADFEMLRQSCRQWASWLGRPTLDPTDPTTLQQLSADFALSERKASAVLYHRAWQLTGQTAYRDQALAAMQAIAANPDSEQEAQTTLAEVRSSIDDRKFPEAANTLRRVKTDRLPGARWLRLVTMLASPDVDRSVREQLYSSRAILFEALNALAPPAATDEGDLAQCQNLTALPAKVEPLRKMLNDADALMVVDALTQEAELRLRLVKLPGQLDLPSQRTLESLKQLIALAESEALQPYVADLVALDALRDELTRQQQTVHAGNTRQKALDAIRTVLLTELQGWNPPQPIPDLEPVRAVLNDVQLTLNDINPELARTFRAEDRPPYEYIIHFFTNQARLSLKDAIEAAAYIQDVLPDLTGKAHLLITARIAARLEQIAAQLETGSEPDADTRAQLNQLDELYVRPFLTPTDAHRIAELRRRIDAFQEFYGWLRTHQTRATAIEVIGAAQEKGLPALSAILVKYREQAFSEAVSTQNVLMDQYQALETHINTLFGTQTEQARADFQAFRGEEAIVRNTLQERLDTLGKRTAPRLALYLAIGALAALLVIALALAATAFSSAKTVADLQTAVPALGVQLAATQTHQAGRIAALQMQATSEHDTLQTAMKALGQLSSDQTIAAGQIAQLATHQATLVGQLTAVSATLVQVALRPTPAAPTTSASAATTAAPAALSPVALTIDSPTAPVGVRYKVRVATEISLTPSEAAAFRKLTVDPSVPFMVQYDFQGGRPKETAPKPAAAQLNSAYDALLKQMSSINQSAFTLTIAVRPDADTLKISLLIKLAAPLATPFVVTKPSFVLLSSPTQRAVLDPLKVGGPDLVFVVADDALIGALTDSLKVRSNLVTLPQPGDLLIAQIDSKTPGKLVALALDSDTPAWLSFAIGGNISQAVGGRSLPNGKDGVITKPTDTKPFQQVSPDALSGDLLDIAKGYDPLSAVAENKVKVKGTDKVDWVLVSIAPVIWIKEPSMPLTTVSTDAPDIKPPLKAVAP